MKQNCVQRWWPSCFTLVSHLCQFFLSSGVFFCSLFVSFPIPAPIGLVVLMSTYECLWTLQTLWKSRRVALDTLWASSFAAGVTNCLLESSWAWVLCCHEVIPKARCCWELQLRSALLTLAVSSHCSQRWQLTLGPQRALWLISQLAGLILWLEKC